MLTHMHHKFDFLFPSFNVHTSRHIAVVHHKLIGFAEIELQVTVVAPLMFDFCTMPVQIHFGRITKK